MLPMRPLGKTGLNLTTLSFGASSLGAEFRSVDLQECLRSVTTAIEVGMNFIDTSPYYGRGMSEVLLGQVLPGIPRDSYYLGTKLGRYAPRHFDFSAKRVIESVDISLERMRTDYLDIVLCHDLEYVEMSQIVEETLPALRRLVQKGKVRYIGVSGYPMKMFKYVLQNSDDVDVILTYNHYTLQNDMALELVPLCQQKGVGLMNAAKSVALLLLPLSCVATVGLTSPNWRCNFPSPIRISPPALPVPPTRPGFGSGQPGQLNPSISSCWPTYCRCCSQFTTGTTPKDDPKTTTEQRSVLRRAADGSPRVRCHGRFEPRMDTNWHE